MLHTCRFVLLNTSHAGNIGAAARAMKTMGLSSLYLVAPRCDPFSDEAQARAKGGVDVLNAANVVDDLGSAIGDCHIVMGTAHQSRDIGIPTTTPREWLMHHAEQLNNKRLAIILGPENHGLSNQQLQQCHYHWQIQTNPNYGSLNLAAAVQVLAYELRQFLAEQPSQPEHEADALTWQQRHNSYQRVENWLQGHPFYERQPDSCRQRLQAIFDRAMLTSSDQDFMLGLLRALREQGSGDDP